MRDNCMGDRMKKYIVSVLLFLPLVANAAPTVRMLGNKGTMAVSGTSAATSKVTPARAAITAKPANVARVGTLRAKSATTATTVDGSTSRFPVVVPAKVYNGLNTPKLTGSTVVNNSVNTDAIEGRLNVLENTVNNNHTPSIEQNRRGVQANTQRIDELNDDPRFDSVRVVGSGTSPGFNDSRLNSLDHTRVWMWVEE